MKGPQGENKSFPVNDEDFKTSMRTGKHVFWVEVAIKPEGVAVRDSKNQDKGTLFFNHGEWSAFIGGVKDGEFDV